MTQNKEKTIISYQGVLTFDKIENILLQFKKEIRQFNTETVVQKRIFSVLVECLENIYRHNVVVNDTPKDIFVELVLIKKLNSFEVRVGNFINNEKVDSLIQKINLVNSMDRKGLNSLYRKSISKSKISEKGGAGLGIIEISRNSNNIIKYELSLKQNIFSFFKMSVLIANPH